MVITLLCLFASTAVAAGPWHGNYTVRITGQNTMLTKSHAVRAVNVTTTMNIKQIRDNLTITFGGFAGVSSATVFKGKVGNGKICANWWHGGSPNQMKVLWGDRKKDGTIRGKFLYPRTAPNLVSGWLLVNFIARKKGQKAAAKIPSSARVSREIRPNGARVNPRTIKERGLDPAAYKIKFDIVRRDSPYRGRIRVTGIVKNVGTVAYNDPRNDSGTSGSGGIKIHSGTSANMGTFMKRAVLKDLKPGAKQYIIYEREWSSTSPSEGEFPPTYWLDVSYDVDMTSSNSPTCFDRYQDNNRISVSGMAEQFNV